MLTLRCECGEVYHADERQKGQSIRCGKCGRIIDVMEPKSASGTEEPLVSPHETKTSWRGLFRWINDPRYVRPYCDGCKRIYRNQALFSILTCPNCGKRLRLKSFNPWTSLLAGAAIISVGAITLVFHQIPIIWIGGFLFGASLAANGFRQWSRIRAMD